MTQTNTDAAKPPTALHVALWAVQGLLFLTFVGTGVWKLLTPVAELGAKFPWMMQLPPAFVRGTGVVDLAGGLGVLLPSVTRIKPGLTVLAALGCALLMAFAIAFHVSRGEAASTPFNVFLAALALFVAWGRRTKAPIAPRA